MNARPVTPRRIHSAAFALAGLAALTLILGACAPAASGAPSGSPVVVSSDGPAESPVPSAPLASPDPSPSTPVPSADPTASPTPVPATSRVWTKPVAVAGLDGCSSVVAAIDGSGTRHLAATCGEAGALRYATSRDGTAWTVTKLAPPAGRRELDPQLAFSGSTLYLAVTRVALEEGGCGDDGLADLGVWVRSRSLPSGDWSEPTRIGVAGDHLQAFRTSGSTLHATVSNEADGKIHY